MNVPDPYPANPRDVRNYHGFWVWAEPDYRLVSGQTSKSIQSWGARVVDPHDDQVLLARDGYRTKREAIRDAATRAREESEARRKPIDVSPTTFEGHNGHGGKDPGGDPWPFGYISTVDPETPIFALSVVIEHPYEELRNLAHKMGAATEMYRALELALPHLEYKRTHTQTQTAAKSVAMDIKVVKDAIAKARAL